MLSSRLSATRLLHHFFCHKILHHFCWKTALFLNLQTSVQLQKQNIRKNFDIFLFEAEKQSRDVLGHLQQHLPLNAMRRTVNATMTQPLQDTVDLNTRRSTQVFLMSVYFSIKPFLLNPSKTRSIVL